MDKVRPGGPARPLLPYIAFPERQKTAVSRIVHLLNDNQTVVVSGANKVFASLNSNIGKSFLLREMLKPALSRLGQKVTYFNLQGYVDTRLSERFNVLRVSKSEFEHDLKAVQESDVVIFDEIHFFMGLRPADDASHDSLVLLWDTIKAHLDAGKRIVFSTAVHPRSTHYDMVASEHDFQSFFMAPVVELAKSPATKR
jgi:hypothetical protein